MYAGTNKIGEEEIDFFPRETKPSLNSSEETSRVYPPRGRYSLIQQGAPTFHNVVTRGQINGRNS